MKCDWEKFGETGVNGWRSVKCKRCGFVSLPTPHDTDRIFRECNVKGLGDYVAVGIELSGIGPLYRRLRGKKCGGCQKRQEALNELGKKVGL